MTFLDLFTSANAATGGMYGVSLPFLLLIIVYGALSAFGFTRAFSSATFAAFAAGLALFAAGIVPDYIMVILTVMLLAATFFLLRSESKGG